MRCVFLLFQTKPEAMRTVVMSNSSVDLEENASLRGGSATTTKIARTARTNTTVVSSNSKFIARSCHTPKAFCFESDFFRVSVERQLRKHLALCPFFGGDTSNLPYNHSVLKSLKNVSCSFFGMFRL